MQFTSYAQNFEDVMLWRALSGVTDGFYIDVGAADPVDMSVTLAFYERNWRGVNIEPAAHYFGRLNAARPADVNLNIALGCEPGNQVFFEIDQTGLSTMDARIAADHCAAGWTVHERAVETTTLAQICQHHAPANIHFLKIDVEGSENDVLAGADFINFRPWIVVVEATKPLTTEDASADWEPLILTNGYVHVWFDGLNRFYVSRERHEQLKQHFQLPPNSFDNFYKNDLQIYKWRAEQKAERQVLLETEWHLQGRLNEVRLLELERHLRRDRQSRMAAELDHMRDDLATARQKASGVELALEQSYQQGEVLTRLAYDLRWKDGPRALRLVLPLARVARKLFGGTRQPPLSAELSAVTSASEVPAVPQAIAPASCRGTTAPRPGAPLHGTVHQFHPGSSYGDAITNSMLLTQRILRGLGYRSEIYVQYRDEMLADQLLLLDDIPEHADYVLIVRHSLGYDQAARIAALPASKILMYHNITPAYFLRGIPALATLAERGRDELDFWRPLVAAALADSQYNAIELRQHGYEGVGVCSVLFDVDALRARAKPRARNADDPFTVLFVGRMVENKGQADLVDAFDTFRRQYGQRCQLVLVGKLEGGDEDYLGQIFERITGHGLRQMVRITGQVSDDELDGWYNRADLYVSLSQHEGFGVPLIEAMAHDLPVIAYAAGAVPFTTNAHDRETGTILFSREPSVVAEAMLTIARDADIRSKIIIENQKNLDHFRLSRHIPILVQALLRAGAHPPADIEARQELAPHIHFIITGHFSGSYSLAAVNRTLALALDQANPSHVRIVPIEGDAPVSDLTDAPPREVGDLRRLLIAPRADTGPTVVLCQHYPVYIPAPTDAPADLLAAYFFWEESLVPPQTIALLNRSFQTILAPSRFVAKVLVDSGLSIPVRVVGYAPALGSFARLFEEKQQSRRHGNQDGDPVTFLHVSSAFPRKGIDVLLNAFARAFAAVNTNRHVRLVIKTFANPHNETAAQIERLREHYAYLPEITLIERDMEEDELLELYRNADAAVLPTRGEGFNVPSAEAAAAGLPLIVTGAGGHTDFLTEREAVLLPWQLQHSRSHLNAGLSLWFEPDEEALATAMRAVVDDLVAGAGASQVRAAMARQAVLTNLASSDWVHRITNATIDVLLARPPRPLRFAWLSSWDVRCGVAEYTKSFISSFESLVSTEDELLVLSDDRTAPQQMGRLRVVPAWHGNAQNVDRLISIINREDPDVVMIQHQPGLISWDALAAVVQDPRMRSRIVVVTLHTTQQLLNLTAIDRAMVLDALRHVARVIVHTVTDVNFLHELNLFDNVVMIPHGVVSMPRTPRPARPLSTIEAPVVGCYGFLLPPKGLRQLIAALPLLHKNWPNLRLRFVNALYPNTESAAELQACQFLANSLGLDHSIEWFTDFLSYEHSMEILGGCDLLVLPYLRTTESSSAALRSCFSSGVALAVSSIPIFDEAEDAVCRIDATSPAGIASGIAALLSNAAARQELQDAAAKWTEPRLWHTVARRVHGMVVGLVISASLDRNHEPIATAASSKKSLE